ncbi:hypothetical protein [Saccharicrinis aurantiacus]|uniref:hypothetical protein n=1 Tax=Saccharicrinis aurantiacus TaxID=1849719 RepID=UPI002492686C|nr:hypothetical protein [Saccharicrinis aurantiacus]
MNIDAGISDLAKEIHVFISNDDRDEMKQSFEAIKNAFQDAKLHIFEDKKHFILKHLGTEDFPEIYEVARP